MADWSSSLDSGVNSAVAAVSRVASSVVVDSEVNSVVVDYMWITVGVRVRVRVRVR